MLVFLHSYGSLVTLQHLICTEIYNDSLHCFVYFAHTHRPMCTPKHWLWHTQTHVHTQTLAVAHTDPRAHTKVSEPWGQWGHLPRNTETARVKVSFHSRNNLPSLSDDYSPKEPKMHQNSWRPGLCPGPHWGSLHHSPDCLAGGVKAYWPLPKNSTIGSVLSSFKLWPIGLALPPAMLILFRRHCAHHTLACGMHTHHMHVHAPTTI